MLGRGLDATFRNFSTLFLLGAIFFVPLHLGHAYAFRDELAVQELRPEIERFSENKKVRNVGPAELARERATVFILFGLDLLIGVGLFGAARRVHEIEAEGDVPTVAAALSDGGARFRARPDIGATAAGAGVALVVAWLVYRIGMIAAESFGAPSMYIGVGLTRGVAAAAFVAIALGCAAATSRSTPRRAPKVDLY